MGLSGLESLDLSSNGLSTVPNEAFKAQSRGSVMIYSYSVSDLSEYSELYKKNYQQSVKFLKTAGAPQGSIVAGSKVTKTSYGKNFKFLK